MILNLLRRQLAQSGIKLSAVAMMKRLTDIQQVTLLYPAPQRSQPPLLRTQLSTMSKLQKKIVSILALDRFLSD